MTKETDGPPERLCEMLPWYVNGTLTDAENRAVSRHLQTCDNCEQELPVLRSLQASLNNDTVAVLTPAPDTERFLARIGQQQARHFTKRKTWAIASVAAGIAVFAVTWYGFHASQPETIPVVYQTASGTDSTATFDYVLHVSLNQETDAGDHADILQTLRPVAITQLETAGDYRIVVRLPAASIDELERYRQSVEADSAISSASVVAVELPLESHRESNRGPH